MSDELLLSKGFCRVEVAEIIMISKRFTQKYMRLQQHT